MPCRPGRRLVQEEQLGEPARLKQRGAMPALKREPAGDPAPARMVTPYLAVRIVQAAAVPVDQAALGHRDQVAVRSDAVLQRHGATLACSAPDIGRPWEFLVAHDRT